MEAAYPKDKIVPIAVRIGNAMTFAKSCGQMERDEEARQTWISVYRELSEETPGLAGNLTSRSEAQVMRLAMIYALLDGSAFIKQVHLEAALALWEYCQASVAWCFGNSVGNPIADSIVKALETAGQNGLTRTDITNLLGRNQPAEKIARALATVLNRELATCRTVPPGDGKGRPTETWYLNGI